MNKLRAELSRLGASLSWQDARREDYDVQCVSEQSIDPPDLALGSLSRAGRYWNFRYSTAALFQPLDFFWGRTSRQASGLLSQRIAHLELLAGKLAFVDVSLASWLEVPLDPLERSLAVGLERLWGCAAERRGSLFARSEPAFHQIYESTPLATMPIRLARLAWLGRALLAATGTDGD